MKIGFHYFLPLDSFIALWSMVMFSCLDLSQHRPYRELFSCFKCFHDLIFYHFQAGLADCGAILEKKGVDGLVMQNIPKDTKIPTCDLLLDGNVKNTNISLCSGWFQIWNHLKCLQALLGMTDSVLQMWSREMKIMQIKWDFLNEIKINFNFYNISP